MKAYVVTYCTWKSIGSVLQALGLKNALNSLGWSSEILQKEAAPQFERKRIRWTSPGSIARGILNGVIRKKRMLAFSRFSGFIERNLNVRYQTDYACLIAGQQVERAFIAGSDQIWNPEYLDPAFFLDFVHSPEKKISYAASMGIPRIPEEKRQTVASYLRDFAHLSVREEDCAEQLRELTGKPVTVSIDPTFLCPPEQWRGYAAPYLVPQRYILLYTIFWDPALNAQLKELKKKTGLPILEIADRRDRTFADQRIYDCGPAEFLWLIDHAELVVTSSFHGLAFSLLFRKPVSAVVNPASPSRIHQLCRTLRVPLIPIPELGNRAAEFDYDAIHRKIESEREAGLRYLEQALERE